MGCGMSTDEVIGPPNPSQLDAAKIRTMAVNQIGDGSQDSVEVIFKKIDEEICRSESECPGPRLSILQSWIEHLEGLKESKLMEINESEVLADTRAHLQRRRSSVVSTVSTAGGEKATIGKSEINMILSHDKNDTMKVRQIVSKLGVVTDPVKAKQNEELLAKISKSSLNYMTLDVLTTMVDLCKKRSAQLLEKYTKLKDLYADLDGILTAVTGGSYVSPNEQALDKELETNRSIRDKLGAVSEQWRICSTLIQASSKSAHLALTNWSFAMGIKLATEKLTLCMDCRQNVHNSVMALSEAQNALPQVDIPSISSRQISELQHINLYLLTDMASEDRSKQIKVILDVYHRNTIKALEWVHDTYEKTVQKNFQDAEQNVQEIAKRIRSERLKFIGVSMGRIVGMSNQN